MREMTISYRGKTKVIDKLVIDTGAAHTLISSDIVEELGIYFENGMNGKFIIYLEKFELVQNTNSV